MGFRIEGLGLVTDCAPGDTWERLGRVGRGGRWDSTCSYTEWFGDSDLGLWTTWEARTCDRRCDGCVLAMPSSVKATYSPEYLAGKYEKKRMNEMSPCILERPSALPGTWHIH